MAERTPASTITTTSTMSEIRVRTQDGLIPIKYNSDDTIADLKRKLEELKNYPVEGQSFTFSGQDVSDENLIREFASRSGVKDILSLGRVEPASTNGGSSGQPAPAQSNSGHEFIRNKIKDNTNAQYGDRYATNSASGGQSHKYTENEASNSKVLYGNSYGYPVEE